MIFMEMLFKGAEAELISTESGTIIKQRISKGYRIPEIDERLRKLRTRSESRLMAEARATGIRIPQIINIGKYEMEMELVQGKKVKEVLNNCSSKDFEHICETIGEYAARLHSADIIHGDLTTSNFIVSSSGIYLIDFGLGFHSSRIEDKASDLHLLRQALSSTHFKILKDAWKLILNAYVTNYGDTVNAANIIQKADEISERGRYK